MSSPSRPASVAQTISSASLQRALNGFELFCNAGVVDEFELKFFRNKGKGIDLPFFECRVILSRIQQGYKMTEGPGYRAVPVGNGSVLLFFYSQCFGNVAGYGGFFC